MSKHKIINVKSEHIQLGIEKYKGEIDEDLFRHLKNAQLEYIPYIFEDGRALLVLEMINTAFLYPSKQAVYEILLGK